MINRITQLSPKDWRQNVNTTVIFTHLPRVFVQLTTPGWWCCRWPWGVRSSPPLWCLSIKRVTFRRCRLLNTTGSPWMVRTFFFFFWYNDHPPFLTHTSLFWRVQLHVWVRALIAFSLKNPMEVESNSSVMGYRFLVHFLLRSSYFRVFFPQNKRPDDAW